MAMRPRPSFRRTRRGLTLVELMLALSVTAMIAGAIASMMAAVTSGVILRRDARSIMIRASAARARLDAYLASCNCLLDLNGSSLVLWMNDNRESDTVHASEVRWIMFDETEGAADVFYVDFPDEWTDVQRDLADIEVPSSARWDILLGRMEAKGLISRVRLIDGIASMDVTIDALQPSQARLISFYIVFTGDELPADVRTSSCIAMHRTPVF